MFTRFIRNNKMLVFISLLLLTYLFLQATRVPDGFWSRRYNTTNTVELVKLVDIYEYHHNTTGQVLPIMIKPEQKLVGVFEVTAYCPCAECCEKWSFENHGDGYIQKTAFGTTLTANHTVAADWTVFKPGKTIIINDIEYVVEDKGGGIKGNRIDIFFNTHQEANDFGRQQLEVYVLD